MDYQTMVSDLLEKLKGKYFQLELIICSQKLKKTFDIKKIFIDNYLFDNLAAFLKSPIADTS
jgi:hypothetical protein